ncbi:hypothetical protein [Amycolatopsis silviterrae]|uniref:PE domain-containing protein n=1 Tax=Amycolatopsis silviterrae TaxID=1656914 RepID=A0ABW5H0K8_9PSEU
MDQPASDAGKNWLPDFTITDGTGSPPGPGFTMSRDDAHSMLRLAKQAFVQFDEMQSRATYLTKLTPPADEPASNDYNGRLINGDGAFGAGLEHLGQLRGYTHALVRKLEQALGITESSEQTAAADVKAAGAPTGFTG